MKWKQIKKWTIISAIALHILFTIWIIYFLFKEFSGSVSHSWSFSIIILSETIISTIYLAGLLWRKK